ncbi:MAG: DUF4931 domain-containing protein [Candidatus Altiarchaeota archaeon]
MQNELRRDYFLDRQVIIAVGRGKRPTDFKHACANESDTKAGCFFCPGSESSTPPEIMRVGEGGKWAIRVFPNKFPAVTVEEGGSDEQMMPAYGRHEIVVETPDHDRTVADLSPEEISKVIGIYSQRVQDMLRDPRVKYALVFKNHGRIAGASLAHSHTQIVSLPVVPKLVREEAKAAGEYSQKHGSCPICDAMKNEMNGPRRIWDDEYACAFAPYASRSPLEAWVMPKRHIRSLKELTDQECLSFAKGMKTILSRLKSLEDAPYNMYFHLSPEGGDLHLHLEVLPRLSIFAGFELGSDVIINTMTPEAASEFYRSG